MIQLTKAEEEVMQVLWDLEHAFVRDILEKYPEPRPAYTTLSTIVRILEEKGVIGHETMGRAHRYHPLISKEDYRKQSLKRLANNYFGGSLKEIASCWAQDEDLSTEELQALLDIIDKKKKS